MATTNDRETAIGMELELEVTNVAHGGVFVARHDGRVLFVADTLPGEVVLARVTDDRHPSFWRAETLRVLEPSPHRVPHVWAEASIERGPEDRAGGAEFGHIALAQQRILKQQVISDSLTRMAGLDRMVEVQPAKGDSSENGTGWRTRVQLHVDEEGRVGPYAARSHRVIPVAGLPLATAEVSAHTPLEGRFPGAESIDVIAPSSGDVEVVVNAARTRRRRRGQTAPATRTAHAHPRVIRELVGDREFQLDVQGFWQVHRNAAVTLSHAVRSVVDASIFDPRAANLDLYGGVGLLAAALGDRFGESTNITSVESHARATSHARHNLAEWKGAEAVTDRAEHYVRRLAADATASERSRLAAATVILDPPRSGAGATVVDALAELRPAQVVYVACDPVALARDLALFAKRGYRLHELSAFDLFPSTHHVEAIARLAI
jgi:tRNA/tmRNA/rRNA uracil-C5-methylase (TrmA/RlmC/RlmD family)